MFAIRSISLLALTSLFSCMPARMRADAGVLYSRLGGTVKLAPVLGGVPLAPIRTTVNDGFGLGDSRASVFGRLELAAGGMSLALSGFRHGERGTGVLSSRFGRFPVHTLVDTKIRITNVKTALTYDLLDLGWLRLAPGAALDLLDLSVEAEAVQLSATERVDATLPVPLAFLVVESRLGPFSAVAELGGMDISLAGNDGSYRDLDARLRWEPRAQLGLFAGFRWIRADVSGRNQGRAFAADLELTGWFLGGSLGF